MHFYSFNIGDYRRDTGHLTLLEHGVYRSLLDSYYLNGSLPCVDDASLMRTHSIRTDDEKTAFVNVIKDFFKKTKKGYSHKKCDEAIAKYAAKSDRARLSAKARWDAKPMRTHSEGNANHKPITKNQEPIKSKPKKQTKKFLAPNYLEVEIYSTERGRADLAGKFFDYYTAGNWKDGNGKQVQNWKQKFITWENNNEINKRTNANKENSTDDLGAGFLDGIEDEI